MVEVAEEDHLQFRKEQVLIVKEWERRLLP